jgi:hypothetical protein
MRYVLGVWAYPGQKLVRGFKIIQKRRSIWWSHIFSNKPSYVGPAVVVGIAMVKA